MVKMETKSSVNLGVDSQVQTVSQEGRLITQTASFILFRATAQKLKSIKHMNLTLSSPCSIVQLALSHNNYQVSLRINFQM